MSVKLAKNGTWLAQFRCKDKFGNEVHKCKRGFATAEEAQAWEDELIASAGRRHGDDFRRVLQSVRSRSTPQAARAHLAAEGVRDQVEGAAFLRKQEDGRDTRHRHRPLAKRPHGPDANDGRPYSTTYLRTLNNQLTAILDHAERYYGLSPNPAMKPVQPNCNIVEKHSAKQCAPDKVNLQERNLTNTAA